MRQYTFCGFLALSHLIANAPRTGEAILASSGYCLRDAELSSSAPSSSENRTGIFLCRDPAVQVLLGHDKLLSVGRTTSRHRQLRPGMMARGRPARLASTIERERRAIDFGWWPLSILGLPVRIRLPLACSQSRFLSGLGLGGWPPLSCPTRSLYPANDPDQQACADEASNEVAEPSS